MSDKTEVGHVGQFDTGGSQNAFGQLVLDGRDTYLRVFSDARAVGDVSECIRGTLHNNTRVTLLQCVPIRAVNSMRDGQYFSEMEVFPHFVLEGDQHVHPSDPVVRKTTLFIDDAHALFYDFDAFGSVLDPELIMKEIAARSPLGRPLPVGPDSQVAYFAGQTEIVSVETEIGVFRAQHCPSFPLGGPRGVSINNEIGMSLEFAEPVAFQEAFARSLRILHLLELLIGRQQLIRRHHVLVGERAEASSLAVHWSHAPQRNLHRHDDRLSPQPADLLVMAADRTSEFKAILRNWVAKDTEMRDARQRFHGLYLRGNRFGVDRLVGAANVFDILPENAVPSKVALSEDLQEAKRHARGLFRALPMSYERNAVLGALGRVGEASLKRKAKTRVDVLLTEAQGRFPSLQEVVDEAINLRNYFVHGSRMSVDSLVVDKLLPFLTCTLEFVFATSDLIECEWDFQRFLKQGTAGSHPFGAFKAHYREQLEEFHRVMGKARRPD